jgi:ribosomal protein S18 acetylase RimI-like enzyme
MEFQIREATADDYDGLCELYAEADDLHVRALPQRFQHPEGAPRAREHIQEQLDDENSGYFVAEGEGRILGLVDVRFRTSPDFPVLVPRRFGVIDTLIVRKTAHRLGVGSALVRRAHQWARERGATQMELTVYEFNAGAIRFYESQGYESESRKMWRRIE